MIADHIAFENTIQVIIIFICQYIRQENIRSNKNIITINKQQTKIKSMSGMFEKIRK